MCVYKSYKPGWHTAGRSLYGRTTIPPQALTCVKQIKSLGMSQQQESSKSRRGQEERQTW